LLFLLQYNFLLSIFLTVPVPYFLPYPIRHLMPYKEIQLSDIEGVNKNENN